MPTIQQTDGSVDLTFPTLSTARLCLSQAMDSDIDDVFDLFSEEAVVAFYDLPRFTERSQAERLIRLFRSRFEDGLGIRWAIRGRDDLRLIGTCGFNSWSQPMRSAVIGYDLHLDFWGSGYAREAVSAIIEWAFAGNLPCGAIHRIQADTVPGNVASEKLLTALGFREEGLRRDAGYWKNQFHDLKCFGKLNDS